MKLTALLLLMACLQVSARGFSQSITISKKNASLQNVFETIEKQTNYKFVYSDVLLKSSKKITISIRNASIDQVMEICLKDLPYMYIISDDFIVIKKLIIKSIAGKILAQVLPVNVRGKVVNNSGESLEGITVTVKGTQRSTATDVNGNYNLTDIDSDGILVFTGVGYKAFEKMVGNNTVIDVELQAERQQLTDVVVVGYGMQKRSDITGAVASVPKERLELVPNTNIAQALQGSVPGLQITTNSAGAEGSNVNILIRGRNSIAANNSPLIIWDGIPYSGNISGINPNDVGSIEVLKDASAAAIYGSRGSNGVILITSKKGKKGKISIAYDGSYGIQDIVNKPNYLNGQEFYDFKIGRLNTSQTISPEEKAVLDAGAAIDWYDLAIRQGQRSQHSLSVMGGSDKMTFYIGTTLLDVKGVTKNDDYSLYSLRPNLEINVTPWLTISSNSQLSLQNRDGLPVEFQDTRNIGGGANIFNPLTTPFNPDGTPAIYANPNLTGSRNPLSNLLVNNTDRTYRIFSANNIKVDLPFIKGLSYKLNTGIEYQNTSRKTYWGRNVALGLESNGTAATYYSINQNFTIENILTFDRDFGKHAINFTALYSSQNIDFDLDELTGSGFPSDVLTNYQMSSASILTPNSGNTKENLLSQMGRLNYSFDSKYLATVTMRRDGFSAFGAGKKYGIFPSLALGWNLSRENFMRNVHFLSALKLRASYGLNGNQSISPYNSLATLGRETFVSGTNVLPGFIPNRLANEILGWESTKSFSMGLDFSLLKNRVQGSIDYYNAQTFDLLLNRSISSIHGFSSILQNIGKTANKGIEVGISSTNIKSKNFSWASNFNISHNRNKIVDLYGDKKDDVGNRWFIGKPINLIYALQYDGIFRSQEEVDKSLQPTAQPGYVRIKDADGDGTISASNDRTILGYGDPKFIWGITNIFGFRSFTLMIFFHGVQGITKENPLLQDNVGVDTRSNTTKKDWWSPTNPTGTHFSNDEKSNSLDINIYENASFARLKDMSLAYDLPNNLLLKLKLSKLKLYTTVRNLATITRYGGLDPELQNQRDIPLQREFIFGLNLGL